MASNGYYGNGRGTVLGPYADEEISAKMRAKRHLEQYGGDIYFARATSIEEARRKIVREHAREQQR